MKTNEIISEEVIPFTRKKPGPYKYIPLQEYIDEVQMMFESFQDWDVDYPYTLDVLKQQLVDWEEGTRYDPDIEPPIIDKLPDWQLNLIIQYGHQNEWENMTVEGFLKFHYG